MRRWLVMTVLSFSGGIIYLLPFLQEVYYIPLADALDLNNTQVGSLLSIFGTTSLIAYFPGGWLADRVSPRKLMTVSLLSTGAIGLYFATFPSYEISLLLHAIWGVSVTLLFWSAMIRMTRGWAPAAEQGKAFGILETGRGFGEVLSSVGLLAVFAMLGSGDAALSTVISTLSTLILLLGVLTWFTMDDALRDNEDDSAREKIGFADILKVLRMPVIWLISIVIFTGYCAYWGTFRFTSYASDIFLLSVTAGAAISVGKMWLKPLAALVAGFIADKFGIARSVASLFAILIATFMLFAMLPGDPSLLPVMLAGVVIASLAVFAMRGIYFALLEEGAIPLAVTGTAAGIVSAVGFTPDIFMPLLGGALLDAYPGVPGYRYFYLVVAGFCTIGLLASLFIYFKYVKVKSTERQSEQAL